MPARRRRYKRLRLFHGILFWVPASDLVQVYLSEKAEEIVNRKITAGVTFALAILILCAGLCSGFARSTPAQTKELRVLVSDGIKPAMEELIPQIEHSTGRKLAVQFDSSKNLRDKIQAGEPFDATILTSDVLDDLIKQGKVAPAGRSEISRTGMGVGVRAGAPKPDVGTPEALKRTLLNAKSISLNPTGASAAHVYDIFARMGIADSRKAEINPRFKAGGPPDKRCGGKAEIVITLIPEIEFFPGVELAGPVPPEYQSYINFAAGIAVGSQDPAAAKALIQFISGPAIISVLKAKGMEPPR